MHTTTTPRPIRTGDVVTLTRTSDGHTFGPLPVVEVRTGGYRLSVRSGFSVQDLFVPFGDVAAIKAL